MVRADGDALVMHVGERPIVVSGPKTIDLSTHGMNLGAMVGMLGQLLSGEALASLKEFGAVEHALPSRGSDHFSVVAARSGDDIWIEIRRRREAPVAVEAAPVAAPAAEAAASVMAEPNVVAAPEPEGITHAEVYAAAEPEAPVPPGLEASAADESEGLAVTEPEPAVVAAPEAVATIEAESQATDEADSRATAEAEPQVTAEPEPSPILAEAPAQILAEEAAREAEPAPLSHEVPEPREAVEPPDTLEPAAPEVELVGAAAEHAQEPPLAETVLEQEPALEPQPEPVAVVAEPIEEVTAVEAATPAASADTTPETSLHETVETSSHEEVPAVPVMASAGVSAYPASTLTTGVPMDPARHPGSSADGPPSRPVESPAPPTGASSGPGTENAVASPGGPVTRTVRIEVPPRAASSRAAGIDRLLRAADALGASELFLVSQARPYVRVGGNVRALQDEAPLLPADIESLIADVTPEPWRDAVRRGDPAEWLIELVEVGRVRCSTFRDHRGPGANFHFAFLRATTADDLQLNADTRLLATEPDGLVLVAGGPGSDVSAIVAAFVDILNHQRADYVIALEPQVRVQHINREALVSQREVGHDPSRMAMAARAALRESPDVLVIEGVASGEVAQIAIEAATQDRLVIASIDAPSAPAAVQRLVDLVPAEQQRAARAHLARCFRGAVAQLLLRKTTGGRIAARELMTGTRAIARLIADGDLARLAAPPDAGSAAGLVTLADTIVEYVRSGLVDVREAVRKAPDTEDLIARLEAAGVNLHALDRWN